VIPRTAPLLLASYFLLSPALAVQFRNDYLKFELPSGWTCQLEQTEFVCEPPHAAGQPVNAIMILAAKFMGTGDTLGDYKRHLEGRAAQLGPKAMLKPPAFVVIQDILWVDATLAGSEVTTYDTRYLATARDEIAILFTFSAHRSVYDQLLGAAVQAVYTLQILDDWKLNKPADNAPPTR
jgi:hypothetical protein